MAAVELTERPRKAIRVGRHQHDVHMVRHQAIRPNLGLRPLGGGGEQIEIKRIIAILEERPLPVIPALRHMMRQAGNDDAGQAGDNGSPRSAGDSSRVTLLGVPASASPLLCKLRG
jgi:hypothetical protein